MAALYETDLNMKVEDVEKMVLMAEADNLPFTAMLGAPSATVAKRFTWTGMRNANPVVAAIADAAAQTTFSSEQPTPFYGFCQEFRDAWGIGRQSAAAGTYTGHNSPVWQKKQALKRLYRQLERAFCSIQEQADGAAGGGALTAPTSGPKLRGAIASLIPLGGTGDVQAVDPYAAAFRVRSGAYFSGYVNDFTATAFEAMLAEIAAYQGEAVDLTALMGLTLKRAMSGWVARDLQASGPFNVSTRKFGEQFDVNLSVDVFKFDAGVVRAATTYNLAYTLGTGLASAQTPLAGLLLNTGKWSMRRHMPLEHTDLKDEGQGQRGFYSIMAGLQCDAPCQNGLIYPAGVASPAPA